jgi:metal-responsive CopG/Arc/MetJ family transcriptional regulator
MERKAVCLRLPQGMADELNAIARANGQPTSEVMRDALEEFIVSRRSDKEFKERLAKRLEEDRELMEKFGR